MPARTDCCRSSDVNNAVSAVKGLATLPWEGGALRKRHILRTRRNFMNPAAGLPSHTRTPRPNVRRWLAYMASPVQTELGGEPPVGDSQGSLLLTLPAASLPSDKNGSDRAACHKGSENTKCWVLGAWRDSIVCGV